MIAETQFVEGIIVGYSFILLFILIVLMIHNPNKNKITSKSELISIAGIHATLLAIIVASLSAYTLFISENVQSLEQRAKDEAGKINEIKFYRYSHGIVNQDEAFDTDKKVKILHKILWQDKDLSLKESERGVKAVGIMNSIMCQYPFCIRTFKTEDGHFASKGPPDPIIFEDLKSVQKWVSEIDKITLPLISDWDHIKEYIIRFFEIYKKKKHVQINMKFCLEEIKDERYFASDLYSEIHCDPVESCKDFFAKLIESRKIMETTEYYIKQANAYKNKVIPVEIISIIFLLILFVFIVGVILPLSLPSVSNIWLLWLPFILYGIGYFYLAFRILKFTMN
jgi:hypothetical protein